MDTFGIKVLEWCKNQVCWEELGYSGKSSACTVKASSWPLAISCSSPKRNISALTTVCARAIKWHNDNNNKEGRSYSEKVRYKWFCWALKLCFLQLICKASLIFKSNLELALSIILKERELHESKDVILFDIPQS